MWSVVETDHNFLSDAKAARQPCMAAEKVYLNSFNLFNVETKHEALFTRFAKFQSFSTD